MRKKISIHDIARHLNVSATTVSFVLNGRAEEMRIGAEVKKRVLDYAETTNYRPNLVAKSLRTGKSRIIGMMVEDISDPFFASIARGIERKAYQLGYKIFFASTENQTSNAGDLIKVFRERQVDSYIIAPPPGIASEIQALIEHEHPVILFDRYFPDLETTNVIVDNYNGTRKATDHLRSNGSSQIGFVTLESAQTQMHDRLQGYLHAIAQWGQAPCILQLPYALPANSSVEKIKAFIRQHKEMDGILFGTNYLAFSGLEAINELGRKIPDDLAVVSFDDSRFFRLFTPPVSAVAQPLEKIAETIISLLMKSLDTPASKRCVETIVLETEFIVRKSSLKRKKTPSRTR
ncbi:LacI family DNA-binding transcriptional regulator [Flavisolibacter nicotianae]|uniref:LacI family DNA-binding transcriptional regulator n=1 Tax=Flavisolibacter nicotianae TaxID=2364882 RepID=UPI000EB5044A|nr:LacI family DNA-binding transcriptional regulator [Flavisolibacter nicotianae]